MKPAKIDFAKRDALQKERQRNGARAEEAVARALANRGFQMIEKIEVPWSVDRAGKRYARAKVSGDFRAVDPLRVRLSPGVEIDLGRSVLVEVKKHDMRLPWSAFRPHQIDALKRHRDLGGLSIVAWVDRGEILLIDWDVIEQKGFAPGNSILWVADEGVTVSRKKATVVDF